MAVTDEAWEPPLLSWKGMQLWSVGCRATTICEMFMGLKSKKFSTLMISQQQQQKKKKKKKKKKKGKTRKLRDGEDGVHFSEEDAPANDLPPSQSSSSQLPGRRSCHSSFNEVPKGHSVSIECAGCIGNQLKRNSDAAVSNLKRNSDILRRNSDASLGHRQRISTSSSSPCGGAYERVWVLEGPDNGGLDYMLPRDMKLGGRRSDVSVQLARQDSSLSGHRHSSCSSFSSSSSVASAASAVAKLAAGRRSSASSSEGEQRHLSQLVAGNQFLTHLTAAPVALSATEHMHPSEGFLLDASVRCREAELKDRLIFFM